MATKFANPFKPGAGHMPPYLAGRQSENREFSRLLKQETILENMVLTGLRGVGKTVLLETFKPVAIRDKWFWVGTDLSESATVREETLAIRLMTDLSVVTSDIMIATDPPQLGFGKGTRRVDQPLNYETLTRIYGDTPGLLSDKLKAVLDFVWVCLRAVKARGLIFAYDEGQNLADHSEKGQYPLSVLLDVFQSIQKRNIPFMLILTGLPTLFPKLVEARTFAERMFRVVFLNRLDENDSRDAILKPIRTASCPVSLGSEAVDTIVEMSSGYPYFIQFICREVFDAFLQKIGRVQKPSIPAGEIMRKLDSDFFAGRWARATDRQRELLTLIAKLENCDSEFTIQAITEMSKKNMKKPLTGSQVNQMLAVLINNGLVYKNRHGWYSFAVPLFGQFILRQTEWQG